MSGSEDINLLPVYLIAGDDALKREAVMRRLRLRLEQLGDLSFNSDSFSGETATGEEIVAACQTIPFACEKRLVTVEDADKLKKKDIDPLLEYLSDPLESTVLALLSQKSERSSKLYKTVSGFGRSAVIDCSRPKKSALPAMVVNMARVRGLDISDKAARRLIELVGEDTVALDGQLEKLALACEGHTAVDVKDINIHVAQVAEAKPWEFVNAFSARDLGKCMKLLSIMPSVSPHALMSMCVSRIRDLICARSLAERGNLNVSALASALGQPDWKVKGIVSDVAGFSASQLREALFEAAQTERKMKSGTDPDAAFLDWMISVIGSTPHSSK